MEIFNKNPSKAGIRKRAIWTAASKNFPEIKFVLQKLLTSKPNRLGRPRLAVRSSLKRSSSITREIVQYCVGISEKQENDDTYEMCLTVPKT